MEKILQEIRQQPESMRALLKYYTNSEGQSLLSAVPTGSNILFLGMGASFHAAEIATLQCNRAGKTARAVEAEELIHMPQSLLEQYQPVIYISQSGESAEVNPLVERLPREKLVAVTNNPESSLARAACLVLPLYAGDETLIASKTYVNSLVLLWFLVRSMTGQMDQSETKKVEKICRRVQLILDGSAAVLEPWRGLMDEVGPILFVGRGEHAVSARHAAMMMAEWAKRPVQYMSLGSFRHGFIELSEPGVGMVIFASSDDGLEQELDFAGEVDDYGVNVLLAVDGSPRRLREPVSNPAGFDRDLGAILDAVPAQLWAVDLAQRFLPTTGFRHLKKIMKRR